jgi:hypothetical protein
MRQVRYSEQEYQSAWLEWDLSKEIPDQILAYVEEEYWIYDSDTCGNDTFEFVVRENHTETYWKVEHAWWWQTEPEWDLVNEFDIEQIDTVSFSYPKMNRDWLKLTQR